MSSVFSLLLRKIRFDALCFSFTSFFRMSKNTIQWMKNPTILSAVLQRLYSNSYTIAIIGIKYFDFFHSNYEVFLNISVYNKNHPKYIRVFSLCLCFAHSIEMHSGVEHRHLAHNNPQLINIMSDWWVVFDAQHSRDMFDLRSNNCVISESFIITTWGRLRYQSCI